MRAVGSQAIGLPPQFLLVAERASSLAFGSGSEKFVLQGKMLFTHGLLASVGLVTRRPRAPGNTHSNDPFLG